ncbi:MAG: hypothetical protein LCH63_04990 [Candidatus Melainabacteria bacterium]|nr:hypothetical protein [Candidatus Melainabacteria bacterium]
MNHYQINKKYLKQLVARHVKEGFLKRKQIIDLLINEFQDLDDNIANDNDEDNDDDATGNLSGETAARQLDLTANTRARRLRQLEIWTDHALAQHQEEERRYPPLTDCDRIERAFQKLQEQNIIARQHFSCCNSCGHRQIESEGIKLMMRGQKKRGYVFYHKDDTERAARSGLLYLTFGAFTEPALDEEKLENQAYIRREIEGEYKGEIKGKTEFDQLGPLSQLERNQQIGEIVQETLASEGLEVSWSGSALHRISVTLNWQKRRKDAVGLENDSSDREKSDRQGSGSFKRKRANLRIVG